MPLNIRNPLAGKLAKELAARRNITQTEAIIFALQSELKKEMARLPLESRLNAIIKKHTQGHETKGADLSKAEITDLWEN